MEGKGEEGVVGGVEDDGLEGFLPSCQLASCVWLACVRVGKEGEAVGMGWMEVRACRDDRSMAAVMYSESTRYCYSNSHDADSRRGQSMLVLDASRLRSASAAADGRGVFDM